MKESRMCIKYRVGKTVYEDDNYQNQHYSIEETSSNNGVKLVISPKEKLELISLKLTYNHKYETRDRFFVNGYQSWTTSYEACADDSQKGLPWIIKLTPTGKRLASTSGDYSFTKYSRKPGVFHSFTYTYIINEGKTTLYGSLNERTGFTIFYADMNKSCFIIEKDVEGVSILKPYELINVVKIEGGYDEVFDKYFAAQEVKKPKIDHLSGYTSWYNYFQNISQDIILRDLEGLDKVKECANIFQIDDGYAPYVGDWLDSNPARFPEGMKKICDKIHEKGFLAGIWLAPFNVQKKSRIAKERPDWLLKNRSGKPVIGCIAWGGAYVLDVYSEPVRDHIRNFFNVISNEWAFDMFKLDFLYSQCMFPRNGKSRGQIMCEAVDFLRECLGEKLILGCGVPLGAAFGKVDACRIGCDMDLQYLPKYYNKLQVNKEIPSVQNSMTSTIFRRHLNGRAFLNDPDVFFLRDANLKFTWEQKKLLAKINSLFGNVLFVSDNISEYSEEALQLLKDALKKSQAIIISVENSDDKYFTIKYLEGGEQKKLCFDLNTGNE